MPSIRDLSESEKARFKKRIQHFYIQHFPEGNEEERLNKCLQFTEEEDRVIQLLCDKYKVDRNLEESQARRLGVFPGQERMKALCPYTQLVLLPEIPSDFSELFSSSVISNDSALYFVSECKSAKAVGKEPESILVISHPVIFECTSSGVVTKSFQVTEIEKLWYDEDEPKQLAIVTKDKDINLGDLMLKFDSSSIRDDARNCLTALYKSVMNTGAELPVDKMLFLHPSRLRIKEQSFTTSTSANRRDDLLNKKIVQRNAQTESASPARHPFVDSSPSPPLPPAPRKQSPNSNSQSPPPPPPSPPPTSSQDQTTLDNLVGEEKTRVRKRIELFYSHHAPQELQKPGKLDTVMSLDATEAKVIRNLCTKYRVTEDLERQQAEKAHVLPLRSSTSSSPSNTNNSTTSPMSWKQNPHVAADNTTTPNATPINRPQNNNNNHHSVAAREFEDDYNNSVETASSSLFGRDKPPTSPRGNYIPPPCTKCKIQEDYNKQLQDELDGVVDENKSLVAQLEGIKLMMLEIAKSQGIDVPTMYL